MTAQVGMALIFVYSGRFKKPLPVQSSERAAFLPISVESMAQHHGGRYSDYRWSGDSGQGTEGSSSENSRDASPADPTRREQQQQYQKPEADQEDEEDGMQDVALTHAPRRQAFLGNTFVDRFLSKRIPGMLSERPLKAMEIVYEVIDRTILILGFIALTTGGVTYAGIFVSEPGFRLWSHHRC